MKRTVIPDRRMTEDVLTVNVKNVIVVLFFMPIFFFSFWLYNMILVFIGNFEKRLTVLKVGKSFEAQLNIRLCE